MSPLTDHGLAVQSRLSQAYGLSPDAVLSMMDAVSRGGGMQAQFNVPELGGMGQWQSGGMTMVGSSGASVRVRSTSVTPPEAS